MNPSPTEPRDTTHLARRVGAALALALAIAAVIAAVIAAGEREQRVVGTTLLPASRASDARASAVAQPVRPKPAGGQPKRCLDSGKVKRARAYAARRSGTVSFAVLDECGRLVGGNRYRTHYSASVVKVMLLVAYLRRPAVRDHGLSDGERHLLGPMIKSSDNGSASAVYGIVGADGLLDLAHKARMRHFTTTPTWGSSEITPGDQARFVGRLEGYVPRRHESYALGLMARVIGSQRWGVPQLKLPGWKVHLKGGWSPQASGGGWRVNQVALLTRGERRLSLAIFTSDDPDFGYGQETIEGVTKRLLGAYRGRR